MSEDAHYFDRIHERISANQQALREEDIAQQKDEGRCKMIPLPNVATQPFRSELTLERHPLFVVNAFKEDFFVHERTVEHPLTKEPIIQRVSVGKLGADDDGRPFGVLRQAHQEVLYKLLKLWGEQGYPLNGDRDRGVIKTTVYDLVRSLRGDDAAHHYKRVRRLIRELSSIPITYENAYTWQGLQDLDEFTLIGDVRWRVRKIDKETLRPKKGGRSQVEVLLSETITEGFLRKNVKQLLWQPYLSLGAAGRGRRAEVARLLYPLLDHELASKDHYNISLTALAKRLGMAHQPSKGHRRRPFTPAVKLLNNQPILGEKYRLRVALRDSADGTDYVLCASRAADQLRLKGF